MQTSPRQPKPIAQQTPTSLAGCGLASLALLGILSSVPAGCSLMSPKDSLLADYEQTRRGIENPIDYEGEDEDEVEGDVGVYRPEGVSAESGKNADLLQQMGLKAKNRKNVELAREQYQQADALFEQAKSSAGEARAKLFREAAEQYKTAAENWRSSGLEQDALMMAAESHFFAEDYYQAEQLYAKLIKEYPRNPYSDHLDSRRFEIADYWLKADAINHKPFVMLNVWDRKFPWNDTGGHGKRVLENVRLDSPTGKVSDDATMRLAVEDFQKGKYESAADTFADLRLAFPDSEHLFNAQFLELQALLASYQGSDYSSVPLTEAQKRVKQLVTQFPQEAAEKQEELNQAYAKIRYQMAERVWKQAEYRIKRQENGSAKFHCNRLLDDYADTPYAERAREALAKLEGLPDDPPQRFEALVWLFGEGGEDRPWRKEATIE